jgi:hypothetical protein
MNPYKEKLETNRSFRQIQSSHRKFGLASKKMKDVGIRMPEAFAPNLSRAHHENEARSPMSFFIA